MERFNHASGKNNPEPDKTREGSPRSLPYHIEIEERADGMYEKISFLHEPMERYKDDLTRIEIAIESKKQTLAELEENLAAHASVGVTHIFTADIGNKIKLLREAIGRLEVTRNVTQRRLMLLARQDHLEEAMLEQQPLTDTEH